MNCTHCTDHACRTLGDCNSRRFDKEESLQGYHESATQEVIQAAAHLVDNGRGGTLNRLEEVIESTNIWVLHIATVWKKMLQ